MSQQGNLSAIIKKAITVIDQVRKIMRDLDYIVSFWQ
jgi:hypothetical protein